MADFSLTPEQQGIIEKFKSFTQEYITPKALEYDERNEFPWEVIKAAYEHGCIHGVVDKQYGGNGYSIFDANLATEEMAAGCVGMNICIDASMLALTPAVVAASDELKKRVLGEIFEQQGVAAYCLTEPNAGSDVASLASTAVKKGDTYILNGHKRFITNAEVACYHTVFAVTDPEQGLKGISAFFVRGDSPGITIKPRINKMGQRATVQNEIIYENVEVPAANLIGAEGAGFITAMTTFDRTRTCIGSSAVGNARNAYEIAKNWVENRVQFGKPIAANQAVGFMLADMATKIETARMINWRAGWAFDTKQKDYSKLSAMAKLYTTDMCMEVTTDAVQLMGGEGYCRDQYPVEKCMRDAKLSQIYEGTNQIQRVIISKHIIEKPQK